MKPNMITPLIIAALLGTGCSDINPTYTPPSDQDTQAGTATGFALGADISWTSVDCEFSVLPEGIVPDSITDYVKANYPESKIYKAEKEFGGYEIGLTGGVELIFNTAGKYVRVSR